MTGCRDTECSACSKTGLFNEVLSTACYPASNDRIIVRDERENVWNEKVIDYFKVIYQDFICMN
jgi:hypothetical protein